MLRTRFSHCDPEWGSPERSVYPTSNFAIRQRRATVQVAIGFAVRVHKTDDGICLRSERGGRVM
jgi:hypothetical protein